MMFMTRFTITSGGATMALRSHTATTVAEAISASHQHLPLSSPHHPPSHCHLHSRRFTSSSSSSAANSTSHIHSAKPRVLVLAGPTGIGKTHLSLLLARRLNGEIVSSDSVQQYRGCDIGSAKVDSHTRSLIPHHCIDIADLGSQPMTANDWSARAHSAIKEIHSRGRVPIVCGGSGFYTRHLIQPGANNLVVTNDHRQAAQRIIDDLCTKTESPSPTLEQWQAYLEQQPSVNSSGRDSLLRVIAISHRDRRKITQQLELVLSTGGAAPLPYPGSPSITTVRSLPYDYRCFYLTTDRDWLNRQTDLRCEMMIRDGLLQETKKLEMTQHLSRCLTVANAIGYRQALDFLRWMFDQQLNTGSSPETSSSTAGVVAHLLNHFPSYLSSFQSASRSLIRRQDIWFRKEKFFQFVPISTPKIDPSRLATLASLSGSAITESTWNKIEHEMARQYQLSEAAYWNDPQWPEQWKNDRPQHHDDGKEERIAPSSTSSPLQQLLRTSTRLASKSTQKQRQRYHGQPLLFDSQRPDQRAALRDLLTSVVDVT